MGPFSVASRHLLIAVYSTFFRVLGVEGKGIGLDLRTSGPVSLVTSRLACLVGDLQRSIHTGGRP